MDSSVQQLGFGKSLLVALIAGVVAPIFGTALFMTTLLLEPGHSTPTAPEITTMTILIYLVSIFLNIPASLVLGPIVDRLIPSNWQSLWISGLLGLIGGSVTGQAFLDESLLLGTMLSKLGAVGTGAIYGTITGLVFGYMRQAIIKAEPFRASNNG